MARSTAVVLAVGTGVVEINAASFLERPDHAGGAGKPDEHRIAVARNRQRLDHADQGTA
ncbi:hypothetical protein CCP3SC5AM1_1330005 [Gammaproteobacteria bacterium]